MWRVGEFAHIEVRVQLEESILSSTTQDMKNPNQVLWLGPQKAPLTD